MLCAVATVAAGTVFSLATLCSPLVMSRLSAHPTGLVCAFREH